MEIFTALFWQTVAVKAIKTAAQAALGVLGAAALFSEVDWALVAQASALAALACVLMNLAQESYSEKTVVAEEAKYLASIKQAPDVAREPIRPSEEEIIEGNHLGTTISTSDDLDSGAREGYQK